LNQHDVIVFGKFRRHAGISQTTIQETVFETKVTGVGVHVSKDNRSSNASPCHVFKTISNDGKKKKHVNLIDGQNIFSSIFSTIEK